MAWMKDPAMAPSVPGEINNSNYERYSVLGGVQVSATEDAGKGMYRRGRPRVPRKVSEDAVCRCYEPQCCPHKDNEVVSIYPEEIEILKLVDFEGLEQEEAAAALGVSRKTLWRDLHGVRRKIADALVNGKGMEVSGCERRSADLCPKRNKYLCPLIGGAPCIRFDTAHSEPASDQGSAPPDDPAWWAHGRVPPKDTASGSKFK